ncbi:HIG1 domain family member 2A, mitochondrial-like [Strongylocentrotus purpuratus]|uniref:HIG1 domain-containing protein n=1 Tax=Strongylocentrotus purpuratus TaxID=7668 RepID=A0A7M7NTQ5_STRPU|nr:HIG1 domain family member 2A, mitochondrial-like [Strongylocentrotus purpuratus]
MAAIKEPAVPNGPKEMRKSFQYPGDIPLELYDWVPAQQEGFREKLIKKLKQNPFVPIGCLATAGALTYGLVMFKRGNTAKSQTMMRARVAAQGFTIAAILVGVFMGAGRTTPTEGPK